VYYDEAEKLSRPEIERLQLDRLRKTLAQAAKSPFYSALFREHGVEPEAVRTRAGPDIAHPGQGRGGKAFLDRLPGQQIDQPLPSRDRNIRHGNVVSPWTSLV